MEIQPRQAVAEEHSIIRTMCANHPKKAPQLK